MSEVFEKIQSSFKRLKYRLGRKKRLPVLAQCRNCGTSLQGRYCHNCGQFLFSGTNHTVWNLIYNALDSIFVIDSKIFATLRYLMFYPGKLPRDYVKGHVVKYVHPSKLFWFVSLIFFALLMSHVDDSISRSNKENGTEVEQKELTKNAAANEAKNKDNLGITFNNTTTDSVKNTSKDKNANDKEDVYDVVLKDPKFISNVKAYAPYVSFLLIPFFTFLLYICFRKYKRYYGENMIFAMNFFTFVYVYFGLLIIFSQIFPTIGVSVGFYLWIPAIYFALAVYNFYRPRIFPAILKIIFIMFNYLIIGAIVIIMATAVAVYMASDGDWAEFSKNFLE